jgi:hypothetical protein
MKGRRRGMDAVVGRCSIGIVVRSPIRVHGASERETTAHGTAWAAKRARGGEDKSRKKAVSGRMGGALRWLRLLR